MIESEVLPSYARLSAFLRGTYFAHLRPAAGMHSMPGGRGLYQATLEFYTSIKGVQVRVS